MLKLHNVTHSNLINTYRYAYYMISVAVIHNS